jgi:very-short-patch-repair endonuclease/DNA polymerase III delta prime subunit
MTGAPPPARLRDSSYEAWGEEAARLRDGLPRATAPGERWLHLILLTNVLNSQYESALAEMEEVSTALDRISGHDDPELPELEAFVEWVQPWLAGFTADFDRYRDERDQLAGELSEADREAAEGALDQRFEEIKDRVRAHLQQRIEDLEGRAEEAAGEGSGEARRRRVERASKTWTGQLVDLTGRNNLLYYRDLRVGSLPLDACPRRLLFAALQGRPVLLSALFEAEEDLEDAIKRARAVRNKANAHYEERGLETLYLAVGLATWTSQKSAATPAAPVLLVPLRLAPKGAAQEEFELTVTGELEVNPTFLQMLKAEFEIDCDPDELLGSGGIEGIIDTPEELDVTFGWLREKCSSVPGFEVSSRFVVGNFSYAKLPMVRDLEGALEALAEHDLIAALAGDPAAQEALRQSGASEQIPDPDQTPPADEFLVLDADSSQNYAINAVLAGQSLIVKGPPGTGKSQTITNLIATLMARGKRVLFVAEKRAAIDAVLRRVEDVGLGDLVLDLHGGVSSRRQTAQALARALDGNARLARPSLEKLHRKLEQRRSLLNARVAALHERRPPWEVSFYEVICRLMALPPEAGSEIRLRGQELERLSGPAVEQAQEDLDAYIGLGGLSLPRSESPWARATVVSAEEAVALRTRVESLRSDFDRILGRLQQAATETGLAAAETMAGWELLLELWAAAEEVLSVYEPGVFELDLATIVPAAEPLAHSVAARASATITDADYRRARNELRTHLTAGAKPRPQEMHAAAAAALALRDRWQGSHDGTGSPPRPCREREDLRAAFDGLREGIAALERDSGARAQDDSTLEVRVLFDSLLNDVATLSKLPELHRLKTGLCEVGLEPLLRELELRDLDAPRAAQVLDFAWLASLREHLQLTDQRIGTFDGEAHARTVADFHQADREHVESTAHRVHRRCAEGAVAAQDEDEAGAALIRSEAAKKRKHLPIRQLFSAAPEVMTSLKPCWMMSPLLVSQVLPSDRPYFDVVVFDEASQVRPAEAIPAILRGRQLVVAGDERQLPPTDFFSASNVELEEEEDHEAALKVDSSFESILEAMDPFVKFRMLRWHYRSRDERLIAFSNAHLYDRSLTTFPGVAGPDCIRHVPVAFDPERAGNTASSDPEVEKVVDLILEHAEAHPEMSLGVIAMGVTHAQRIEETLRSTIGEDREDLEEFFDEEREEPFFVKNLERVQGDERDAIILSVGYGKNADGRLLYRFGPLNVEGGERRLNVAVTRAKERMTLVSSFDHRDMDPARSQARGVQLLRAYLEYCDSNGTKLGEVVEEHPPLNPFEIDVRDKLTRAGIALEPQFGSSGYRIDFAAKHPEQPGRMVLAIECDGASYHSAPTARDRDRLRQEQLERLGWTFHRIWSQDWFEDKEREVARAVEAYRRALAEADGESAEGGDGDELSTMGAAAIPEEDAHSPSREGPRPVPLADGRSITEYTSGELASLIRWIESDGLLRTKAELREAAIEALGYRRRGPRIVAALDSAIDQMRADRDGSRPPTDP